MRTFGEVKQFAAENLSEDETDSVLSANLLPRWVGRGLERIFRKTWWRWNEDKIDLTWPAPGAEGSILYLPHFIFRPMSTAPTSGGRPSVEFVHAAELDYYRPASVSSTGFRPRIVLHGTYGVEADNPSAGVLSLIGVGGSGTQSFRVHGLSAANYEIVETGTLTAGGAAVVTTNSFKAGVGGVKAIELFGTSTGTVVTASRGGTTLERLDSTRERRHEHLRTELLQAGLSGGATFTVRFWRRPSVPENAGDNDVVPIPSEFHSLLETWLEREILRWRGDYEAAFMTLKEFESDLMDLVRFDRRDPARRRRFRVAWGRGAHRWF